MLPSQIGLFTALYVVEMQLSPAHPDWPGRERCLLSTAHNTAIVSATLTARGLIDPALSLTYCRDVSVREINAFERVGRGSRPPAVR